MLNDLRDRSVFLGERQDQLSLVLAWQSEFEFCPMGSLT